MPGSPDLLGRSGDRDGLDDTGLGELLLGPGDRAVEPLHRQAEGLRLRGRVLDVGVEVDPLVVGADGRADDVVRALERGRRGVRADSRVDPNHLTNRGPGQPVELLGIGGGRLEAERPLDRRVEVAAVQHEVPGDICDQAASLLLLRGGGVELGSGGLHGH